MEWDCHANTEAAGPAAIKLKNADLTTAPFGLVSATVATCEEACEKTHGCTVINWHDADRHCHTLTGPITPEAFKASLRPPTAAGRFAACMLVKQHANIPPRDRSLY